MQTNVRQRNNWRAQNRGGVNVQDLTVNDWLTLAAIVFGPLLGAWFALWLSGRREKRDRRFDIFRTLMRTRRTPIWPDHVGALNLVEIEFSDNPEVIRAWKALFEHFGQPQPRHSDEELPNGLGEVEYLEREKRYNVRIGQERHSLLSKLLHAIGKNLGFKIEQLEIFEGGYTPQGWGTVEDEQTAVRRLFTDIALGRRMFPIGVFHFPDLNERPDRDENQEGPGQI
jgi:hypothetical protein